MKWLPKTSPISEAERRAKARNSLIRQEAKIGGKLFGPIPEGHRREFFCLDKYTWVWFEEWTTEAGQKKSITTRYEVRPNGILKHQDGHGYQPLSYNEALNFYNVTQLYGQKVDAEYQQMLQTS